MSNPFTPADFIRARESLSEDVWYHGQNHPPYTCFCLWTVMSRLHHDFDFFKPLEEILSRAIKEVDESFLPKGNLMSEIFDWNDDQTDLDQVKKVLTIASKITKDVA